MDVCQVYTTEIMRLRRHSSNRESGLPARDEAQLVASIQSVMATMSIFAAHCPIISELLSFPVYKLNAQLSADYQFSKVQEAYAAI